MNTLVVFAALLACASAAPGLLGATLLPKVRVAPAEVTVVKQPYTVQQAEYKYRDVPVPYPVVRHEVVQPAPIVSYAAPAVTYAAAPIQTYAAAPVISSYAAAPVVSTYAAHYGSPAVAAYAPYGINAGIKYL